VIYASAAAVVIALLAWDIGRRALLTNQLAEDLQKQINQLAELRSVRASALEADLASRINDVRKSVNNMAEKNWGKGGAPADVSALTERIADIEAAFKNVWELIGKQFVPREEFEKTVAQLSEVKSNGFTSGSRKFVTRTM
jgi:hypothetical protein